MLRKYIPNKIKKKIKKIIQNYRIHNYLGHPGMQFFEDLSSIVEKCLSEHNRINTILHSLTGQHLDEILYDFGQMIHDETLP